MILDKMGIAVRTGTHCAQPVMDRFGIDGTIRASFCFYNTLEEVDELVAGVKKVQEMFSWLIRICNDYQRGTGEDSRGFLAVR